ncbi:hypothetical protein [Kytococcus sedentarius]|uniref:hypothetical protein n=1 Tax=Kytococcus sedentarius TaxID=1276 RepID=UPI00194FF33F|nr:hypothetical protein [Kytococcus sedentarius]QRO87574.1 hypothetical protein I6J30_00895 [Kytococcus sedentarius]
MTVRRSIPAAVLLLALAGCSDPDQSAGEGGSTTGSGSPSTTTSAPSSPSSPTASPSSTTGKTAPSPSSTTGKTAPSPSSTTGKTAPSPPSTDEPADTPTAPPPSRSEGPAVPSPEEARAGLAALGGPLVDVARDGDRLIGATADHTGMIVFWEHTGQEWVQTDDAEHPGVAAEGVGLTLQLEIAPVTGLDTPAILLEGPMTGNGTGQALVFVESAPGDWKMLPSDGGKRLAGQLDNGPDPGVAPLFLDVEARGGKLRTSRLDLDGGGSFADMREHAIIELWTGKGRELELVERTGGRGASPTPAPGPAPEEATRPTPEEPSAENQADGAMVSPVRITEDTLVGQEIIWVETEHLPEREVGPERTYRIGPETTAYLTVAHASPPAGKSSIHVLEVPAGLLVSVCRADMAGDHPLLPVLEQWVAQNPSATNPDPTQVAEVLPCTDLALDVQGDTIVRMGTPYQP